MGIKTLLDGIKNLVSYGEGEGKWDMGELGQTLWQNRPTMGFAIGDNAGQVASHSAANKMAQRRKQMLLSEQEKKAGRITSVAGLAYASLQPLNATKKTQAVAAMMSGKPTGDEEIDQILSIIKEGADRNFLQPEEYGMTLETMGKIEKMFNEKPKTSLQKVVGQDGKPAFASIPTNQPGIIEGVTPYEAPSKSAALLPKEVVQQKIDIARETARASSEEREKHRKPDAPKTPKYRRTYIYDKTGEFRKPARVGDDGLAVPTSNDWQRIPGRYKKENQEPTKTEPKALDQATATKILQEAGGDKDKAREIAKKRGYKF